MQSARFDSFCKQLATSGTRRSLFRLTIVSLIGASAEVLLRNSARAQTSDSLCGDAGLPCCSSGSPCHPGQVCSNTVCTFALSAPCGDEYQPCCSGNTCPSGLICADDVCFSCGAQDELCCPGNSCTPPCSCGGEVCE